MTTKGLIIIDLEATCCNNGSIPRDQSEIIQIGAVLVNGSGDRISSFDEFVRPEVHPVLTEFCTSLTGITQQQVDNSEPLDIVLEQFDGWIRQFYDVHRGWWGSWGNYDRNQFIREHRMISMDSLILHMSHINLKDEFAKANKVRPMGLAKALKHEGLGFIGKHHNGLDDAANIARLPTIKKLIRAFDRSN